MKGIAVCGPQLNWHRSALYRLAALQTILQRFGENTETIPVLRWIRNLFASPGDVVIKLTRFDHSEVTVNADMIEFLEATPDTVITLVTSRKILVQESVEEVTERVIAYRQKAGSLLQCLQRQGIRDSGAS